MGIFIQNTSNGGIRKFINSLLTPLQYVANLFYTFYAVNKYEAQFNGQIIYMKKYLNDKFDPVQQRIYLYTNAGDISEFTYRKSEDDGELMYRKSEDDGFLMQRINESITTYNFTIKVPSSLSYNAELFNASVNRYKLSPMTYNIETF